MAQPVTVTVTGAVTAAPAATTALSPSLQDVLPFGISRTYSYRQPSSFSVNSPTNPVSVGLGSITKVRFVMMSVIGASVKVTITTGLGTATFPVSERWMWSSPNEGDQITAMSLTGVSDIEMLLLGD